MHCKCSEIDEVFSEAYVPKKLHELNMKDLVEVWNRISEVFSVRRVIVKGLEDELNATELERVKIVRKITGIIIYLSIQV